MKVQMIATEKIKPYPGNPRRNDASVDTVMESIRQFGFNQPIVVDSQMVIIVGHTRHKAAVKLGLKQVPVFVASDLTPEQAAAYRLADNKVGETSAWDSNQLNLEMLALPEIDFSLFGFPEHTDEIVDINDLLQQMDPKETVREPIWITIRASMDEREFIEKGLSRIEKKGVHVERSYEDIQ